MRSVSTSAKMDANRRRREWGSTGAIFVNLIRMEEAAQSAPWNGCALRPDGRASGAPKQITISRCESV